MVKMTLILMSFWSLSAYPCGYEVYGPERYIKSYNRVLAEQSHLFSSMNALREAAGIGFEPEFFRRLKSYYNRVLSLHLVLAGRGLVSKCEEKRLHKELYEALIRESDIHRIKGEAQDNFFGLIRIILGDPPEGRFRKLLEQAEIIIDRITGETRTNMPGFSLTDSAHIRSFLTGRGVKIAVIDSFDNGLLGRQRELYPDRSGCPFRSGFQCQSL